MPSGWSVVPLRDQPGRGTFDCGNAELNLYLSQYARQQRDRRPALTMVAEEPGSRRIVGFYTLSSTLVVKPDLPPAIGKRLTQEVPATLLGRLAVDREAQGSGLGSALLVHALRQAAQAAELVASHLVVVDAIDQAAVGYYLRFGFAGLTPTPRRLFLTMDTAAALRRI